VLGPEIECFPFLALVGPKVIDARHTCFASAHMIENGFDDMRQHALACHSGCHCPAQVVQVPLGHVFCSRVLLFRELCDAFVQTRLASAEAAEGRATAEAVKMILADDLRRARDDSHRCGAEGHEMRQAVLRALRGQYPSLRPDIELWPQEPCDLPATLSRQDEQAHDVAEWESLGLRGAPHEAQLGI